jgi:drug/metabolite transporter (DMT)-like permease
MNFLSDEQRGSLYAVISGLCYGFLGYFGVNLMNADLSVTNMLFWRFFLAALFMLPIVVLQYKNIFSSFKENLKIVFYGMAFYSTSAIAYFIGSNYIGTGLTMVVFFIYPAIVMLFNCILYNAKISKMYYLAFSMIIIGVVFLADLQELELDFLGIGFGILSALCYACYVVGSKRSNVSPVMSTFMVSIGCMVTCLIFSCLECSFFVPTYSNNWINIVGMALFCTALPILLLLEGLKYISSEKASMISVLEPVFVVIFGIILLGETVSNMQIVGTITVLSGALTALFSKNVISQK